MRLIDDIIERFGIAGDSSMIEKLESVIEDDDNIDGPISAEKAMYEIKYLLCVYAVQMAQHDEAFGDEPEYTLGHLEWEIEEIADTVTRWFESNRKETKE